MEDVLRIGCSVRPTVVDRDQPLRLLQWENIDAHLQLYEPLLTYRGGGIAEAATADALQLEPLVAESFERLDGGKQYRFTLRPGVTSAFGNELTAEDVQWAWRRSIGVGTVGAWIAGNVDLTSPDDALERVRVVSKYVVEFDLPFATTILPHLLTVIVPTLFDSTELTRHTSVDDPWGLKWCQTHGVGFGPYVVEEASDVAFRLRANPKYWKRDLAFEAIEYVAVPDAAERWEALVAGDVDIATDLHRPSPSDTVDLFSVPTTWRTTLGINCVRSPFSDPQVRRAIAHAIPYERILADAYGGFADRLRSCVSSVVWGWRETDIQYDYNPERAKSLLSEALSSSPPPVTLYFHGELPAFPRIAEIVGEALREVGLDVETVEIDGAEHSMRRIDKSMDLFIESDGPMTIDGRYSLGHDVNPPLGGVFDFTGYHDDEIDRLLQYSLRETDDSRAAEALGHVQEIAMRDLPWIPLAQQRFTFGMRKDVAGYRWYPLARIRTRDLSRAKHAAAASRRLVPQT